jgi:hypothetical protein
MPANTSATTCSSLIAELSKWETCLETGERHSITESEKSLILELARLGIDFETAQAIWLLTLESPNAVEMTTELLRQMEKATKHKALEAMTKAIVLYPTPTMRRLKMET